MPTADDIRWFKGQFHDRIAAAVRVTPLSVDMLIALACQETGGIWPVLRRKQLHVDRILELCVGDTLDANKGRRAFPRTKGDLVAEPNGERMFQIARQALVDMAAHINGFAAVVKNPNKFCHGYGVFQYDLQFFREDPDYFLERRYARFDASLGKCLASLRSALEKVGLDDRPTLADLEMAAVAIAYNTGGFKPHRGLKQGHFDGRKFYGEQFFDFLRLSKTVASNGVPAVVPTPPPGEATVPPPTPVDATGAFFEVEVLETPLRLRSEPKIDKTGANVVARLPDGQIVQAVDGVTVNGFREVQTSLLGARHQGFASVRHLKPAPGVTAVPIPTPAAMPPTTGIAAVYMPRVAGSVTRRTQIAGAHSLNDAGQPRRVGTSPDALRAELEAIADWLAVDKASHVRYQPRGRATFCNVYAHDYCHLAGVYLPRVWWTPAAIEALAQGLLVEPKLGKTIDEQRANDLFRWLRDFGLRFGWRRTSTLTKLQVEVNQGAVGLVVARRVNDGLSGHVAMVVPETNDHRARWNADGEVVAPLQSQAGATNFRYGRGKTDWWKGPQFADSAFWLHA